MTAAIVISAYYAAVALVMLVAINRVNNRHPPENRAPLLKVIVAAVFWLPCGLSLPWLIVLVEYWNRNDNDQ